MLNPPDADGESRLHSDKKIGFDKQQSHQHQGRAMFVYKDMYDVRVL